MAPDFQQDSRIAFLPTVTAFLRDFMAYAGRKGAQAALFVVLGALVESLGLVLIIPLLGIVIGSGTASGRLHDAAAALFGLIGIEAPFGRLAFLLAIFAVLMIARAAVLSLRDVTLAELQIGFVETQRLRITERLAAAQWDQVVRLRHARITHLMSGDVQRIGIAAHFLLQSTVAAVVLLTQCVLAFLLAPMLALLTFGLLAASAVASIPILRRARALGGFVTNANLSLLDTTTQFLGGLKLAISQNLQTSFVAEFQQTLRDLTHRQTAYTRQTTNTRQALTTLSALVGTVLVLFGFGVFHIAAPVLITLLLIISRMNGPAGQIQQGAQQFAHALPAYEKVKELERELATLPTGSHGESPIPAIVDGAIAFEAVSFRHASDDDTGAPRGVRELTLMIEPGEYVGIAGPSGAGKTTFADLLVGLYPPQHGRVTVGGRTLEGAMLAAWRDGVAYVSQDPFLFHDTIRRNLAWARPAAHEQEMWAALALAGADRLVHQMPAGLDTIAGERGTLLSGGERQRIALARAVLRRPRLLVLDEATSAIDVPGEREILECLRALAPRPTIVMIAHRAESLAFCDRILRLDAGQLRAGHAEIPHPHG